MVKKILHITDFHIPSKGYEDHTLATNFYQCYIKELHKCISDKGVDVIIITGDIVNSKTEAEEPESITSDDREERFKCAQTIIREIATIGGSFDKNKVFVCHGEHDYERNGKEKNFELFDKYILNADIHNKGEELGVVKDRIILHKGILILLLNSLEIMPKISDTSNKRANIILEKIKNYSECNALIIASHHPIHPKLINDKNANHSNWWLNAYELVNSISELDTIKIPVVCLSGDIHYSKAVTDRLANKKVNTIDYFSTGMFGAKWKDSESYKTGQGAQARIVTIEGVDVKSQVLKLSVEGHDSPNKENLKFDIQAEYNEGSKSQERIDWSLGDGEIRVTLLNEEVQDSIKKIIIDKQLYSFGRYKLLDHKTALSWVDVTPLLNDEVIFSKIVALITEKIAGLDGVEEIFGIDTWGAIIASQVSLNSGIPNRCLFGKSPTDKEKTINQDAIKNCTTNKIVLIVDVVSLGKMIQQICNDFEGKEVTLFSVIVDPKQKREKYLSNIEHYSLCTKIKMPILSDNQVPDEEMLPVKISCAD